jgi:hypothetical protein
MMRKQILILLGAGLIGLMYPTASQALVFTFSFTNTTGTTNGTVTGDIDGLVNGTGVAATNVILDSYPTGLGLPSPPLDIVNVVDNTFDVSNNMITSAFFEGTNSSAFLVIGDSSFAMGATLANTTPNLDVNTDTPPTFVLSSVPEPASAALLATGLAALWQLRRRQRRPPA